MTINVSSIQAIQEGTGVVYVHPPYYEESPYKPTIDSSLSHSAQLAALASVFKETLGSSNVITGSYAYSNDATYTGYSLIANCGNFRLLIGHLAAYAYKEFRIGITYDDPSYTTYAYNFSSTLKSLFGSHINYTSFRYYDTSAKWYDGFKCQLIKDTDTNTFYLVCSSTNSNIVSNLCYAFGNFGTSDKVFLMNLTQTGTGTSNYDPQTANPLSYNCACLKKDSNGLVTSHNSLFYPLYLFDRVTTKGAVSGSSIDAKKYISGVQVWDMDDRANYLDARELLVQIPPTKLGRVSTYSTVPRGTTFNHYNNIVAIDNVIVPWSGNSSTPFVTV